MGRVELAQITSDKPREECGVVGVWLPGQPVAARRAYFALHALQHRGQEAAGICGVVGGQPRVHKDLGLVAQVFRSEHLDTLACDRAIGHVRYSTTGSNTQLNAQPIVHRHGDRWVAVAHNGNLTNTDELRAELGDAGVQLQTTSDSELLAALASRSEGSTHDGAVSALSRASGGFAVCLLADDGLYAFRDRHGIRPLELGLLDGGYVIASETCALDLLGAQHLRSVVAGELIHISEQGLQTVQVHRPQPRPCVFEGIYFARPDSRLGSETVYDLRVRLGEELAYEAPADADAVIAVPDSATAIALGYANRSGLPYQDGLIKNRYIGRSFIQPTAQERDFAANHKFNPLASAVCGKRLVVVDDSIVRGTTLRHIVRMLRDAGAVAVHLRIGSPPALHPCHYGVDMGHEGDFIAEGRTPAQIAEQLGADSLQYLSLPGLSRAVQRPLGRRCTACFSGDYPVHTAGPASKDRFERPA